MKLCKALVLQLHTWELIALGLISSTSHVIAKSFALLIVSDMQGKANP